MQFHVSRVCVVTNNEYLATIIMIQFFRPDEVLDLVGLHRFLEKIIVWVGSVHMINPYLLLQTAKKSRKSCP